MCWSSNSKTLSWLGIMWGLLSLATLLTAFFSNVWLYTKEPIRFPNSDILTTVTFKIGLWRICPSFKRTNATPYLPHLSCTSIKYSTWEDISATDLGLQTPLEFTPLFLSKMRISTLFGMVSIIFIFLATASAFVGVYNSDHKTIVACGLFIFGGLTLGGGLLIFASVLSDAYFERPKRPHVMTDTFGKVTTSGLFDYKYGWSFFAAGAAFFMAELAAVLSISAYARRFPTVEDMVRVMVPGAERRLKEHSSSPGEYLVQHKKKHQRQDLDKSVSLMSGLGPKCKSETLNASEFQQAEEAKFLNKPAPDICTSNPPAVSENIINFCSSPASSEVLAAPEGTFCRKSEPCYILQEIGSVAMDSVLSDSPARDPLAGQTVPIVLMHHPQRPPGAPFTLSILNKDNQRNSKTTTLPLVENSKKYDACPSRRVPFHETEISGLDQNLYSNQCNDLEDYLNEKEKFNFGLKHFNPEAETGLGTFFGTFHSEKTFTDAAGAISAVPDTFSTGFPGSNTGSGAARNSQTGPSKKRGFNIS